MTEDSRPPSWSELRHAAMSAFEARLYQERAGLDPRSAVRWWEHYILSGEAAQAIAAGWTVEDVVRARDASLPASEAIRFGELAGLPPVDVTLWWKSGVTPEEAAEALAAGWSLDEAIQQHPSVVQRREHQEALRREAETNRLAADARAADRAREQREREDADYVLRKRRRLATEVLRLHATGGERFELREYEGTYWAIVTRARPHDELGVADGLSDALAFISEQVAQAAGSIDEVTCLRISPDEFVACAAAIAGVCARQVVVKDGNRARTPPPHARMTPVKGFRDPYNNDLHDDDIYDDDDDSELLSRPEGSWQTHDDVALVMRKVVVGGHAALVPALPDAWPGFVRYSDTVAAVGALFLMLDNVGEGWEAVGRFEDVADGIAATEQRLRLRDESLCDDG